jgi:hypothetical protein
LAPAHDEFSPADRGEIRDDSGGGNFVAAQVLPEGDSGADPAGDGHHSAIVISATLTGISCGIILALVVYVARRKRRMKAAALCLSMPEVKSDVVGSAAETKPTAAETGPEKDDSSSEEGYFGTIRVRKCVSPGVPDEEGKMDDMDISTLGDPFVSEHTGWNNSENAAGERYASLSSFASLSPRFDFSYALWDLHFVTAFHFKDNITLRWKVEWRARLFNLANRL